MDKRNNIMKKKKAFSLIELIISLIVIALITAAFTPVISKKLKSGELTVGGLGGGGTANINMGLGNECHDNDESISLQCLACINGKCIVCDKSKDECQAGEYLDREKCNCVNCDAEAGDNCTECSKNWLSGQYTCKRCQRGYKLVDNVCVKCTSSICDGKNEYGSCGELSSGCTQCDNVSGCTMCGDENTKQNYYIEDGECKPCPRDWKCDGVFGGPAPLTCDTFNAEGIVKSVGNKCIECTIQKCVRCENGYYIKSNQCHNCPSGYTCDGINVYGHCTDRWENCEECDATSCTGCPGDKIWDDFTEDCVPTDVYTYSASDGFMWTKYNPGDAGGPKIPNSVAKCTAGQTCSDGGGTNATCWKANIDSNGNIVANGQTGDNGDLYEYSGNRRTLCNWWAAEAICEYNGMRLPTRNELEIRDLTKNANYNICSHGQGTSKYARCDWNASNCKGATSNHCNPHLIWASPYNGTNNNLIRYESNSGSWEGPGDYGKSYAASVRCVKRCDETWPYCKKCNKTQCETCMTGYHKVDNGQKCVPDNQRVEAFPDGEGFTWSTRNPGDPGGPKIPGDIIMKATDAVHAVGGGSTSTCWYGQNTGGNGTTVDSYPGGSRTLCNWMAAEAICEYNGMRLPTRNELENHNMTLKKQYGICSTGSGSTNYARCDWTESGCWGATSNHCNPHLIWASPYNGGGWNLIRYESNSGSWEGPGDYNKSYAASVRCVKRCDETWPYCVKCTLEGCVEGGCMDGYKATTSGDCVREDTEVALYSDGNGFMWSTRNPGDPKGPVIPSDIKLKATFSPAGLGGGSTSTCWYGQNTGGNGTTVDNYSGSSRTLCNWMAAESICAHNGMRLPTRNELENHNMTLKKDYGICSSGSGSTNYARCDWTEDGCWGATSNHCNPHLIWASPYNGTNNNLIRYESNSGSWEGPGDYGKQYAASVRCVKRCNDTWPYCTKCKLNKCETCMPGYYAPNGYCERENDELLTLTVGKLQWTTRNPGDPGGPMLDPNVRLRSTYSSAVTGGGTTSTCWYGYDTGKNGTIVDDYSGSSRTLCNWFAARDICEYNDMRLPTRNELETYNLTTKKYGICSNGEGSTNYARCDWTEDGCWGATSNHCNPHLIWASPYNGGGWNLIRYESNSGSWEGPGDYNKSYAASVRCVKDLP